MLPTAENMLRALRGLTSCRAAAQYRRLDRAMTAWREGVTLSSDCSGDGVRDMDAAIIRTLAANWPSLPVIPEFVAREAEAYPLHPVVRAYLRPRQEYRPWPRPGNPSTAILDLDMDVLWAIATSWPHESAKQPGMLAYTRNIAKGREDKQSIAKPGAYLQSRLGIPGHEAEKLVHAVRNVVARHEIVRGSDALAKVMTRLARTRGDAPMSCMVDTDWNAWDHPYRAYSAGHGWALVLRYPCQDADIPSARAIVQEKDRKYVRAYGSSVSDRAALIAWLEDRGYQPIRSWEGYRVDCSGNVPYIDGTAQRGQRSGGSILIGTVGPINLARTDGGPDDDEPERVETWDGDDIEEEGAVFINYYSGYHGRRIRGYARRYDCIRVDGEQILGVDVEAAWDGGSIVNDGAILQCADCGRWMARDDGGETASGDRLCPNCGVEDHRGDWVRTRDAVKRGGQWVARYDPWRLLPYYWRRTLGKRPGVRARRAGKVGTR